MLVFPIYFILTQNFPSNKSRYKKQAVTKVTACPIIFQLNYVLLYFLPFTSYTCSASGTLQCSNLPENFLSNGHLWHPYYSNKYHLLLSLVQPYHSNDRTQFCPMDHMKIHLFSMLRHY